MAAYQRPRGEHRFAEIEREILRFWKANDVFERSLRQNADGPRFVFYEGPPTANGLPHNGHVLTRVVKDLFPRYKAMRGYDVPRKAGWDTHGLPVEVEVEKELDIHGQEEIQSYGLEPFAAKCIESVFRYTEEWERLTERIGFWIDLGEAYVTYHKQYVESVWWALAELFRKGLLYRGHKVVWWWPQGGTALSSGEVGLGYKTVDDPEVVVRFVSRSRPDVAYLAWTTTPWTLASNVALAVSEDLEYSLVRVTREDGEVDKVILASSTIGEIIGEREHEVLETMPGSALVGDGYQPVLRYAEPAEGRAWEIIAADFVGADQGTGLVHIAPAFGEDDFRVCQEQGMGMLQLIEPDGTFSEEAIDFAGRFCKEADRDIIRLLRARGLVFKEGTYRHDYPFCWRASDDPLIQYARPAWFIRTTAQIDEAIANNRSIFWLPEHIKEGRFGDFLANNVDWALSRERFWGTPLPIWECASCGELEAFDSVERILERDPNALEHWREAKERDPDLSEHLVVHKPWIDQVQLPCRACGKTMRRVSEVIDCWFDSGCMPFAQFGFPHKGVEEFRKAFPADFISEAIDQTRGWFYSMLMVSTLVFDEETQRRFGIEPPRGYPHPYKTCIVLGHVCDPEGKKESKSSGNYTAPDLVLEGRFTVQVAPEERLSAPPAADAVVLQGAQVKTLGVQEGATLRLEHPEQPERAFEAKVAAGTAGREAVVLGDAVREALGVGVGDQVVVHVLDDPPGADAFRWFFFSAGPPWNNTRNSLRAIREQQNEFLVRWSNVLSFFLIYASIDGFDPAEANPLRAGELPPRSSGKGYRPAAERARMDRWILSEAALTARRVTDALEGYRIYDATVALRDFVDGLSNWYVRRSRSRFWAKGFEQDKRDAYWTLWEVLVDLSLMAAPFVPYFAEHVWRTLVVGAWPQARVDSVHLAAWPEPPEAWVDEELSRSMSLAREIVSLGLSARASQKVRVRQPLRAARVFLAQEGDEDRVTRLQEVIADELNVKDVVIGGDADAFVHWKIQPNFRAIGPKYGKLVPQIKKTLAGADGAALRHELDAEGRIRLEVEGQEVELGPEEIQVTLSARERYAAASSPRVVVVLETDIDEELRQEGRARELINRIQTMRKELDLDYADRIRLTVEGSEALASLVSAHGALIRGETLAVSLEIGAPEGHAEVKETELDGVAVRLGLSREAS
jgi:isoleucyl-tRNA synthetase